MGSEKQFHNLKVRESAWSSCQEILAVHVELVDLLLYLSGDNNCKAVSFIE